MNIEPNLTTIKRRKQPKDLPKSHFDQKIYWNKDDATKSEFDTLIEEYKIMKSEIAQLLLEARQITNLTLTATGILAGVIVTVVQTNIKFAPEILLIIPFFFYFLTCIQLRYIYQSLEIHKYLSSTTIPHIQSILFEALPHKKNEIASIMNWEVPNRALVPKNILFLPIAGASYGMPFLFSILLVVIYFLLYPGFQLTVNLENVLLTLNAIALIYCASWTIKANRER